MISIHRLSIPLIFPNGIAPGEGSDYNVLRVARDGCGDPVLRGTTLIGALRHAWIERQLGDDPSPEKRDEVRQRAEYYFGHASDENDRAESRLSVNDAKLNAGKAIHVATHHRRNRHTGAVAEKALFSVESCPKDTAANVTLWLKVDNANGKEFLAELLAILEGGQTLGGKAARGFGDVRVDHDRVGYRAFKLPAEYGEYLDEHRKWRSSPNELLDGETLAAANHDDTNTLRVTVRLAVPRGQDILLGDGQGLQHEIEPESVVGSNGVKYWRIRGSAVRGILRAWFTRLAAKESKPVADSLGRYQAWLASAAKGKTIPYYSFEETDPVDSCVVSQLFGSTSSRGRIHIANAYAKCSNQDVIDDSTEVQERMHVAVDRVTGGAAESMLFENTVLTSQLDGTFELAIRIDKCRSHEARWLAKSLVALHLGVLRIGSSKSSGRLEVRELEPKGKHVAEFANLRKLIGTSQATK